jgi:hypothetical protein
VQALTQFIRLNCYSIVTDTSLRPSVGWYALRYCLSVCRNLQCPTPVALPRSFWSWRVSHSGSSPSLKAGASSLVWQRATTVIIGWFAGRMCTITISRIPYPPNLVTFLWSIRKLQIWRLAGHPCLKGLKKTQKSKYAPCRILPSSVNSKSTQQRVCIDPWFISV